MDFLEGAAGRVLAWNARIECSVDDINETININLTGENMGAVIGRRGDTLDAIQYLTSIVANKNEEKRWHLVLDTENYRAKRRATLERLANNTAQKAIRYKRSLALEPMNPQERRIIHAALQECRRGEHPFGGHRTQPQGDRGARWRQREPPAGRRPPPGETTTDRRTTGRRGQGSLALFSGAKKEERDMMQQTIAAHSGGALPAAIGICRVSGPQAFAVADQLFRPKKGGPLSAGPFSTMRYGDVLDTDGRALDICLACCYKGPASYTGEDLVEIFCHGSQAIVAGILDRACQLGARPAQAGEFTRRAFLAGKLDLTEVEAVGDLIHAQSAAAAKNAAAQLQGGIARPIRQLRDRMMEQITHFYAVCDYPDEDLDPFTTQAGLSGAGGMCPGYGQTLCGL